MTENPPSLLSNLQKRDAEHLQLLSIFHFVMAGLALLGILFLLCHYAIFSTVFNNPKMWQNQKDGPPPAEFFAAFKWLYLFFGTGMLACGSLNLLSGFSLRARKRRMFSLVVAGINCLMFPLGTALGVFTIIILQRDSIRELYEDDQGAKVSSAAPLA